MKKMKRILSLVLALSMMLSALMVLTSCGDEDETPKVEGVVIDNENTRLVLSTSELDGVFNPFYYSILFFC